MSGAAAKPGRVMLAFANTTRALVLGGPPAPFVEVLRGPYRFVGFSTGGIMAVAEGGGPAVAVAVCEGAGWRLMPLGLEIDAGHYSDANVYPLNDGETDEQARDRLSVLTAPRRQAEGKG